MSNMIGNYRKVKIGGVFDNFYIDIFCGFYFLWNFVNYEI